MKVASQMREGIPLPVRNKYKGLENDDEDTHPLPSASGTGQCGCNCDNNSLASASSSSLGELEEVIYGQDEDLCQECLGAGGEDGNSS